MLKHETIGDAGGVPDAEPADQRELLRTAKPVGIDLPTFVEMT